MSNREVLAGVVEIVHRVGRVPATKLVTGETRLVEDLGIDSLDLVAVFLEVQDRYGIVLDDDVVPEIRTVAKLVEQVQTLGAGVAA